MFKMVYFVYSLESPQNTQYTFMLKKIERYPYNASWPGVMINTHSLELPLSRTYFRGSKGIRAIEVLLFSVTTQNPHE